MWFLGFLGFLGFLVLYHLLLMCLGSRVLVKARVLPLSPQCVHCVFASLDGALSLDLKSKPFAPSIHIEEANSAK
jgi:hypothetical protein